MTIYATNNPIGSMDPKDLFDNAQNLDYALNDVTKAIWTDRFGRSRKSYWGMEQAFSAQLLSQQQRFNIFIQSSGYKVVGEYTAGPLTVTDYNQLIRYQDEFWKLTSATSIPFTTTGNDASSWASDSAHFVGVGDAALRQELAAPGGAGLVDGVAKPVTWSGFAGGADPTGVNASDAAFISAGASGGTCYVPGPATYQLNTLITSGTWIISDGVTFTGTGGIRSQAIRLSPLINDHGLSKGGRWVSDAIPAKIHRFRDRLFVAGSANNAGGISATSAHSWLDDPAQLGLIPGHASLEQNATVAVATESGLNAGVFATRASDYSLSTGSTIGLTAVALNDKTTTGYRQGALGLYVISALSSNASSDSGYSQTGMESNLWNQKQDASQIDPYNFFPTNLVKNIWLSNGFPESEHTRSNYNSTCAIGILNNVSDTSKAKYRTGIAFKATAIEGSDGVSGRGIAISFGRGHSLQWHYLGGSQGSFINCSVDSATNEIQALEFTNFGLQVKNRSNNKPHLLVASAPSIANYPRLAPSAAGSAVRYMVDGDDADIDLQLSPKGAGTVKLNASIVPTTDNARDFGSASLRGRTAYFGTGTINTSDSRHKPIQERIPEAVLDAWAVVDWRTWFKFDDAISEKGEDGARWHFGLIAQRVEEIFSAHGIDGFLLGLLCYDEWEGSSERRQTNEGVEISVMRVVQQVVMTTVQREVEAQVLQPDGSSVTTTVLRDEQVPLLEKVYAFDDEGEPVLNGSGEHYFTHKEVMEEVRVKVTEPAAPEYVDIVTPAGNRYGIRYEEALALEAALQRRNYQRQQAINDQQSSEMLLMLKRIEAMEAR